MKKLFLLIMLLLFTACTNVARPKATERVKNRILEAYEKAYPEDDFFFLYGPDYDGSWGRTNIRYRGILTSKKLEELDYPNGFQVNLENVESPISTSKYNQTLKYLEVFAPLKREAKDIFGEDIIFEINGSYTTGMHRIITTNIGKNLPVEEKTGFRMIILSTFVDDLDKEMENIDYWKNKIYQLGKKYWEYYNVLGALQIYLYASELLQDPYLLEASLGGYATEDDKIKISLDKLKAEETLDEIEKSYIINKISSDNVFMAVSNRANKMIGIGFSTHRVEKYENLVLEKVEILD